MGDWVGTFGVGQELRGRFVRFRAEDRDEAVAVMRWAFGERWSMVYSAEEFEGQAERHGLREIALMPDAALARALLRKIKAAGLVVVDADLADGFGLHPGRRVLTDGSDGYREVEVSEVELEFFRSLV